MSVATTAGNHCCTTGSHRHDFDAVCRVRPPAAARGRVGALCVRLRQPVLIAYIVIGIALGPAGLGLVKAHDQVALLAQIGVTVLLFIVGLKLDLQHVRHIGPLALATGLGQLGFTIAGGFVLILLLGQDLMTALYASVR